MIDAHGRTIDYLRISVTDRCNFRCVYCMPEEGVTPLCHTDIMSFDEILTVVRAGAELGIRRIRLTGGEPLVRKGIVSLVREIAAVPGIDDVSLTTNGVALPRMARSLREAGLRRVNISLDTLDAEQFALITRVGRLQDTLDGIDAALEAGFNPVKLNAVTVRRLDQDFFSFARMSVERPLHVRFIEYMPVGNATDPSSGWGPEDVVSSEEVRAAIDERAVAAGLGSLVPLERGNGTPDGGGPARYFQFAGAQGTVGFISPLSRHFCSQCNRLRLSADGKIMPCLFSDLAFDIKQAAATGTEEAKAVLVQAMGRKPDEHHDRVGTERGMSQIGG